ncbi:MAG: hypothetical protein IJ158_05030 [Treponema sp.]|nr:hypothetical protein [Treponema sp.]
MFVGGLETKESLLEGVEFLTENGVVVDTSIWKPCIGSALEGHRSPETDWHIDLLLWQYTILKKYGVPYEHYYWTRGDRFPIAHLFQLDGGHMSWEEPLEVID